MKSRLVRIGNPGGIRIPRPLIEQAGLSDEVELEVLGKAIVIAAAAPPRSGWAEAARALRAPGGGVLLDQASPTKFEDAEWRW
jgi:antitoxin MazE